MSRITITSSIVVLLLVMACALGVLAAPPAGLPVQQGVLLLRNGHVIEGKIVRDGERYYVTLEFGEIRVKANEVLFVCRDLDDCYQRRKALLPSRAGDVNSNLELADWCIDHGLLGYAVEQLLISTRVDPRNVRIGLVERRLELAQRSPEKESPTKPRISGPVSNEKLEAVLDTLPRESVETFTNVIQPLLLNSCSTGRCHGFASDTAFQLHRVPVGRTSTRRSTLRNLHSTLAWLDRSDAAQSPLLIRARQVHGGAKEAPLSEHETQQWQNLIRWVVGISTPPAPPRHASVEQNQELLMQTVPRSAPPMVNSAELPKDVAADSPQAVPKFGPREDKSSLAPQDDFDPAIFNRRYFPDRTEEASPPASSAISVPKPPK